MVRSALRQLRPTGLLLFLLTEILLVDTGSLTAAVALAATATAAVGSALAVCAVITARSVPAVPPTGCVRPSATASDARPSCPNGTPTPRAAPGPEPRAALPTAA